MKDTQGEGDRGTMAGERIFTGRGQEVLSPLMANRQTDRSGQGKAVDRQTDKEDGERTDRQTS